jgi:hypothetical protein
VLPEFSCHTQVTTPDDMSVAERFLEEQGHQAPQRQQPKQQAAAVAA